MEGSLDARNRQVAPLGERLTGNWFTPLAALFVLLLVAAVVYWPGLNGPFLFDDYSNLAQLGARGPIESFELVRLYLLSGFAGPLGRPLSLLSFLIDANNWPAEAWPFKRTNLVIHLVLGAILFGTTRKLFVSLGRSALDASWLALIATTLWVVNPFLVSTTLYAVQRMSQLAALFIVAGIWCYLHGRALLATHRRRAYAVLCIGLPAFTVLAALSKENGILLPLLVLVLHATLSRHWVTPAPARLWTTVFLGVPSAVLVGYLLLQIGDAERLYLARDFSMYERVLSQARFLWNYLYYLFIPHIQTEGLFQDGRAISTGLLQPWTTAVALVALLIANAGAWIWRARWPLWSLALWFFLAGHVLESTVVPLEPYFEHRNYLPAVFLFLPLAVLAYDAMRVPARRTIAVALTALAIGSFTFATWQHAALWGNEDQLLLVWAKRNPTSVRAQVSAAQTWTRNNDNEKALAILEEADRRMPDSPLLIGSLVWVRAELGRLTLAELEAAAKGIRGAKFDPQATRALEQLVMVVNKGAPLPEHTRVLAELLQGVRDDLDGSVPTAHRLSMYLEGLLFAGQGRIDEAMPYLHQAFDLYDSMSSGLRMVSDLADMGYYGVALEFLARCETLLGTIADSDLDLARETYQSDIARLRQNLEADLKRQALTEPLFTVPWDVPKTDRL